MQSRLMGAVSACALSVISTSLNAALVNNGGGLIYDDVLDVTWAQPDSTLRAFDTASTWAAGLTLGGVSRWRLPYISVAAGAGPLQNPVNCILATEVACRDNELGYMFYHNLGGTSGQPILRSGDPDLALFPTLQANDYWSGTYDTIGLVWDYRFDDGSPAHAVPEGLNYSWAVHAGNVGPVPVPAAVWLFGSGLLGLVGMAKRKVYNQVTQYRRTRVCPSP